VDTSPMNVFIGYRARPLPYDAFSLARWLVRAVGPGARRGYVPGPLLTASALAVGVPEGLDVGPHSPAICRGPVLGARGSTSFFQKIQLFSRDIQLFLPFQQIESLST
jgi:hypothetical protein